jgi:hypothetical protein
MVSGIVVDSLTSDLDIEGSNIASCPSELGEMKSSMVVRHLTIGLEIEGSNPATLCLAPVEKGTTKSTFLASGISTVVEHSTFAHKIKGSS